MTITSYDDAVFRRMSEGTRGPIGGKGVRVGSALVSPLAIK